VTPADEWRSSPDPARLVELLGDRLTLRRARLFAVGYCRVHQNWITSAVARRLLELLERIAGGMESESRLAEIPPQLADDQRGGAGLVRAAVIQDSWTPRLAHYITHLQSLQYPVRELDRGAAIAYASRQSGPAPRDVHADHPWHRVFQTAYFEFIKPKADLLRCLFANPFGPVAFDPAWLTSTVRAMARGMYEGREFSAMPILADALQDAGCESEELLGHCRGPGPHVRGCWVVDLVLGQA
jgi:hypothetical protein